jgi:hypothetical protein
MNRKHWTSDELAELDAIVEAVMALDVSNSERAAMFGQEIDRAADQAHREWAHEIRADAMRRGYMSIYRTEVRKGVVLVEVEGVAVEKPAMISVPKLADEGQRFQQLAFYEVLTREQIAFKRREYLKARNAYDSNVAVMDKLTAMLDAAEADDVQTAAAILGVSVESWLLGEAAAA